jgi:hypothetical protein
MDFFAQFTRIGRELDATRARADASIGYDVLAGAVVWSDEYPLDLAGRVADFDCVKLLLRFRTTVILGDADESLRAYWCEGQRLFPNWAGFRPERIAPTPELRDYYEKSNAGAMRNLRRVSEVLNRAAAKKDGNN